MSLAFQILLAALPILLPPLISLSVAMYQHLLQRLPQQVRQIVEEVAQIVVLAVEQTSATLVDSPAKKQAAMKMATEILQSMHVTVSQEMLSAMIEAAVFTLNQSKGIQKTTG
jgi:LL-H family phage holin